ncbi:MAG: sensor histidine kinase, partial [Christensenellales bacterium]
MKQFKTIRSELSRFISIAFIILQIIMSLTIYLILTNTMIAELSKSRIDTLVLVSEKLHMLQTNMRTISNMFYEDHHIYASIMGEPLESSEAFDMEAYITIQSFKHRRAFKELSNKFDVAILSDSGHRYHSNRSMRIDLQGIPDSSPSARPDQLFFVIGDNMSTREDRAKNLYLSVQNYYNVLTEQYVGNLFICVDEREVYNCYAEILNETNSIFFVDPNGLIVSHRDEGLVNTSLQSDTYKDFLISDEPYQIHGNILMSKYYSPDTGLYIVEENMLSNVLEPMQSMILGIIVVVLSISGLAILMSFVISRRITRPLNMFCSNIVEAGRGNMEPTNIESQYLEINQLSYNFNDMKRRVKTLMDNIKRQEKHLRESELKFLRAQINPHLIYNTLYSIRCNIEK